MEITTLKSTVNAGKKIEYLIIIIIIHNNNVHNITTGTLSLEHANKEHANAINAEKSRWLTIFTYICLAIVNLGSVFVLWF